MKTFMGHVRRGVTSNCRREGATSVNLSIKKTHTAISLMLKVQSEKQKKRSYKNSTMANHSLASQIKNYDLDINRCSIPKTSRK